MAETRILVCSEPGCTRPAEIRGLCTRHYQRDYRHRRRINDGPIHHQGRPAIIGDDVYTPCPPDSLGLAAAIADIDARAIVRTIWPHLLEAHLAGRQPFTLEPTP